VGCEGIEVSPGTDILVEDDPAAFARAVIELIRNRAKREEIGNRARELVVSRYSWVGIGKQLNQIYEAIVSSKSNRATGK
jgi:glycosyltransferase involved in cell wall biosynthesis